MELFSFSFVKPMAFKKLCDGAGNFYCDNTPKCPGTAENGTNIHHMLPTELLWQKHGVPALSTSRCRGFQDDSLQSSSCWIFFSIMTLFPNVNFHNGTPVIDVCY